MTQKNTPAVAPGYVPPAKDTPRNRRQRELIAKLKQARNITDSRVAALIGTNKGNISKVKSRERELTLTQEIMLYDLLGYTWTREMLLKVLPEDVAEVMRTWDNERANAALDAVEDDEPSAPASKMTGPRHA